MVSSYRYAPKRSARRGAPHPSFDQARPASDRDQAEARRLLVPFAPTIVINGLMLSGAASFDRLDRMVRAEMERGFVDRLSP